MAICFLLLQYDLSQALALGTFRSILVKGGESSSILEPFYSLQLSIQDPHIHTITEALLANFAREDLDSGVEDFRCLSIEELPNVLILHLKRFVYNRDKGRVQKIMKQVEYGLELKIESAMMSAECQAATGPSSRNYKLFSVIYHKGRGANKGHYVADVLHQGHGQAFWMHCDDSRLQPTLEELVVAPASSSSTPYILFYMREDSSS